MLLENKTPEEYRVNREGVHSKMRRMREELARLERDLHRKQILQRMYTRIEAIVAMRPSIKEKSIKGGLGYIPLRILTNEQFNVELSFKAETARAKVPPEYRPKIEIENVIWEAEENPDERLADQFQASHSSEIKPPYNGGLAEIPPSLTRSFNAAADPLLMQPYKVAVNIGFTPV